MVDYQLFTHVYRRKRAVCSGDNKYVPLSKIA